MNNPLFRQMPTMQALQRRIKTSTPIPQVGLYTTTLLSGLLIRMSNLAGFTVSKNVSYFF